MRLNELSDNPGAIKIRKRLGRGLGSGKGKTGGRGGKGQKGRSGVRIGGFEGGQMPLHRRLPKRGFNSMDTTRFNEVNLGRLQAAIDSGRIDATKPIDVGALVAAGMIRRELDGVRLLAKGELKSKLTVSVRGASAGAVEAVKRPVAPSRSCRRPIRPTSRRPRPSPRRVPRRRASSRRAPRRKPSSVFRQPALVRLEPQFRWDPSPAVAPLETYVRRRVARARVAANSCVAVHQICASVAQLEYRGSGVRDTGMRAVPPWDAP